MKLIKQICLPDFKRTLGYLSVWLIISRNSKGNPKQFQNDFQEFWNLFPPVIPLSVSFVTEIGIAVAKQQPWSKRGESTCIS